MIMRFKDHFSGHADAYRHYRPGYPARLFAYLAQQCPQQERAWDCATGSGQSALALTTHFEEVLATDASARQIEQAVPHEKIRYEVAPAEHTDITATSIDLITVAQALHWFDLDSFAVEVKRVLKPGGILAAWTYQLLKITPEIDAIVQCLYEPIIGEYWPPERRLVESGYAEVTLPFTEISPPPFEMPIAWDLNQLQGYLDTWSAVRRYEADRQVNPLDLIRNELEHAWGAPDQVRSTQWPLTVRVWRNDQ